MTRQIFIRIRTDPKERATLERVARAYGRTISDHVRASTPGFDPPRRRRPRLPVEAADLVRALVRIQINLVQIADGPHGDEASRIHSQIDALKGALGLAFVRGTLSDKSFTAVADRLDAAGRDLNRMALLWNTGEVSDMSDALSAIEYLIAICNHDLEKDTA